MSRLNELGGWVAELLVATLRDVPQVSPPGEVFSYNNAGYVLLGRIIERLTHLSCSRPSEGVLT